ncbi:MAG: right-handed parallel beta-helix repeat-containing protein, partial [Thermoplasmata archaeon]
SVRVSGNLVVKQGGRLEVYNGRFFGDYTKRRYGSAYLQGSEFSGLIGNWNASGIQVYSSEVTIVDCKVFSNKETRETILSGIMCISSSPTIIRTKVENFGLGIKVISSNAKIDSCEIKRNNKGIMAIESKPEIVSCIVEYNEEVGLGLYKSEGKVENCKIIRNSIGIECVEGTNTKILSNEIIGSNIGIKMVESSPEILQNRIVECNEGINGYYSNVIIRGNSFENDTFAYHSIGNGYPLSFMSENQILNVQSVIRQSWMLTLRIEDENENPLTANIEVRDINGKKVFEGKSREDGVVSIQLCEYQVGPDENYNPYKIKVSKGTAYEKFSIIVDNNLEKRVVIVLSEESVFSDMSLVVILAIIIFSIILFVFLLFKRRSANKRKNKGKKRKKRSSRF